MTSALPPRQEFAKLRLGQFFPTETVRRLENWEFMGRTWIGEAIGFSEWLCPVESETELQSLAIDFEVLPRNGCERVLATLGLPLKPGMSEDSVRNVLGEPIEVQQFVSDRKSLEFKCGTGETYTISCTLKEAGGLSYLVVTVAH